MVVSEKDFRATFEELRAVLKPYEAKLYVVHELLAGVRAGGFSGLVRVGKDLERD